MSVKTATKNCTINNLPKSFIDSSYSLHRDEKQTCKVCLNAEKTSGLRWTDVCNSIPWITSRNIPPCIWGISCGAFYNTDNDGNNRQWAFYEYADSVIYKFHDEEKALDTMMENVINDFPTRVSNPYDSLAWENEIANGILDDWDLDIRECNVETIFQGSCLYAYIMRKMGVVGLRNLNKIKTENLRNEIKQNGMKSVDELMLEFSNISIKDGKPPTKTRKPKRTPAAASVPRIVKAKTNRIASATKVTDETSVKKNKYHKRFLKTKKPTKL